MAFRSNGGDALAGEAGARGNDALLDGDWAEPTPPPRDWKKLALVIGLGALSWVATYVGMLELIESNMGELPLVHKVIIGFSVAMLMIMIVWLLDQLFAPIGFFTKVVYAGGYVFLSIISIGFGFGFYWKVLESKSEASRSAESAVSQVQGSLHAASTRLEQLQSTLAQLTLVSQQKAETERASGTSCPNSKPGDGPRRKMREEDAARFAFASDFVKGRVTAVRTDMTTLDGEFVRIAKDTGTIDAKTGNRNEFMKGLSRKLDMTVTGFNAFRTDPQLKQIRADLAERAEKVSFADTRGGTYACPDPQLQTALRGVVRAIDQLPELEKPKIAAVEGSEATIEAFRRLTATFYGALSFKLPPSADELRQLQQKAVQSVEQAGGQQAIARQAQLAEQAGLSKRDYVPLAIAIFVDLCLLLVSMGRPVNRLHGLVPKMRAAERGPVYQILSKFSDIHKDEETREKFEIFRHVVFDFNGDYYVAVPLDAPYRNRGRHGESLKSREYTKEVAELQLEAHLLANLFSSFEKERIFTRVHSPFLTKGTIQRKLWRQGSKFAGSEAFRVYRFRDGAWSEIILGAVMGAARRVEGEKRRRRREDGHALDMPAAASAAVRHGMQPPASPVLPGHEEQAMADRFAAAFDPRQRDRHAARPARASYADPARARSHEGGEDIPLDPAALAEKFGPYAHSLGGAQAGPAAGTARRGAGTSNYREMAAALSSVNAARQAVREAEVSVRAANNNTAPPAERAAQAAPAADTAIQYERLSPAPAIPQAPRAPIEQTAAAGFEATLAGNVVPLPRVVAPRGNEDAGQPFAPQQGHPAATPQAVAPFTPEVMPEIAVAQPGPGMIGVTVRRETATFTVPVSEARLPQALEQLIVQTAAGGHVTAARTPIDDQTALPTAPAAAADVILLPAPAAAASDADGEPRPGRRYAGEPAE